MRTGFNFFVSGTPQIDPKKAPCFLCMRCSKICPSRALEDVPVEKVRMGYAELDRKKCYVWREELVCRSCFERCPLKGSAIRLDRGEYPVITDQCAGCGVCEHVCPRKAITTYPTRFVQE